MSSLITAFLIFLLPLFFLPGSVIDSGNAKAALISVGVIAAAFAFLYEAWRGRSITIPKTHLLTVTALLPAAYFLSAILSTPSALSLLGYNLEPGTFGFMALGAALLAVIAMGLGGSAKAIQALAVLFASLSLLILFVAINVFSGPSALFGIGNLSNPLGSWMDVGVASGLLALLSALAIGMVPMRPMVKVPVYAMFLVSLALFATLGFPSMYGLMLVAAVLMYIYFWKLESAFLFSPQAERAKKERENRGFPALFGKPVVLPALLAIVSLAFFINPMISEDKGRMREIISAAIGIDTVDVRPTLAATLGISKAVLSQQALLGSGPNTWSQDWLIFRPAGVNATPFWSVVFLYGAGFIPTQIASTGILGSALWLVFLVLLAVLGVRAISGVPETRAARFALMSTLITALFLWASAFFYAPSAAMLAITFAFTGFLIAVAQEAGLFAARTIEFLDASPRFAAGLAGALIVIGGVMLGWNSLEKSLAAFHFRQAVALSAIENTPADDIEARLERAIRYAPLDRYYAALSQLNFARAQMAANSTAGTPEENQAVFQESLSKAIEAARTAVGVNPAGFGNWVHLGNIYAALVPKPLEVAGAYENAQYAYGEAFKRHPSNPELPLLLAQLELSKEDFDSARSYIRNSIALKSDYPNAYIMLAQLEKQAKNIPGAIASTERLLELEPNNPGVHFEMGLLKYSSEDYEGAEKYFSKALELKKDYANAKYYLGLTLAKLGNTEEAKKLFEELLVANPDNEELKAALEGLTKSKR